MMREKLCSTSGLPRTKRKSALSMENLPKEKHSMLMPRPSMPMLEKFNGRQLDLVENRKAETEAIAFWTSTDRGQSHGQSPLLQCCRSSCIAWLRRADS